MSDPLEVPKSVAENLEFQKRLTSIQHQLLGLPAYVAVNILLTLLVDVIAQACNQSRLAEPMFDEAIAKAKSFLMSLYSSSGRRNRPDGNTILRLH